MLQSHTLFFGRKKRVFCQKTRVNGKGTNKKFNNIICGNMKMFKMLKKKIDNR